MIPRTSNESLSGASVKARAIHLPKPRLLCVREGVAPRQPHPGLYMCVSDTVSCQYTGRAPQHLYLC